MANDAVDPRVLARRYRSNAPGGTRTSRYVPHHYALFIPRPHYVSGRTVHNGVGFRDHREFAPGDPSRLRIACIGGSTTYETHIEDNARIFTARLEALLAAHVRAQASPEAETVEVVNAGCGAATSAENLARLAFFVAEIEPRIVFVQHGFNDTWARVYGGRTTSDYSNLRRVWAEGVEDEPLEPPTRLARLFTRLAAAARPRDDRPEVISDYIMNRSAEYDPKQLDANPPRHFRRNTEMMIGICDAIGALCVLATEPFAPALEADVGWRARALREHNDVLREIARERGVPLLDLAALLADDALYVDQKHLSEHGNDLKADAIFRFLVDGGLLARARKPLS